MFYSFKWLKSYFIEHKFRYIIGILATITEQLIYLIPTYLIGNSIDLFSRGQLNMTIALQYLAIVFVVLIICYFAEYTWVTSFIGNSVKVGLSIKSRLIGFFIRRRAPYYEKFTSGDLMARSTNDVQYLQDLMGYGIMIIFSDGVYALVVVGLLVNLANFATAILAISPYILHFIVITALSKVLEVKFQQQEEAFSKTNDKVLEEIEGIRNIRAYARDEDFRQKFEERTQTLMKQNNEVVKYSSGYAPFANAFSVLVHLVTFIFIGRQVIDGQMSLGTFVMFHIYVGDIVWCISNIGEFVNILQNANVSTRRIEEILQPHDGVEFGNVEINNLENIEFDNYSFTYPSSQNLNLLDISLKLPRGTSLGIVGKTGSGKSTLIKQFLGLYEVGSGKFEVNGISMSEVSPKMLSSILGYVPQDNTLFSDTIRNNVSFGLSEIDDEKIIKYLKIADFDLEREKMKDGLDTLVGENGLSLSGGQKQRLSIARALIVEPELLILDDSLSAVDATTEKNIISKIKHGNSQRTSIISSHRLSGIEDCDEIIVIDEGRIVERGTHPELIDKMGWYFEQFLIQKMEVANENDN